MTAPALEALVVGIDHYLPHELAAGISYPSLNGCVRDARRMATFLTDQLGVPPASIHLLTSSAPGRGGQPPCPTTLPSAENMVAAWKLMLDRARPGEEILIHYSGHGGRAPTAMPHLKGEGALDECLVPYNIGAPGARYVRDTEIFALLALGARRGVFTTLILDCCHSGGAARSGVAVRGIAEVDTSERSTESLVGDAELFASLWRERSTVHRGLRPERSFRSQPRGYAFFAACRAQEFAYEAVLEGFEPQGALTYWLLKLLAQGSQGLTYAELHQRLIGRIHCRFPQQTPQFEGEGERLLFNRERVAPRDAITVLELEPGRPLHLRLNTGQAQGVRPGARFAIERGMARLGVVEIVDLGAVISAAKVVEETPRTPEIAPGDRALPLDPGAGWWARRLRLAHGPGCLNGHPISRFPGEGEPTMKVLSERLAARESSLLAVDDGGSEAGFSVGVGEDGSYEIGDDAGRPLPGLLPRIILGSTRAEERVIERLLHLAKFAAVRELDNHDATSELSAALELSLGRLPRGFQKGEKLLPEPFADAADLPTLEAGEYLCLTITNRLEVPLNVAVLDLQPNWAVEQVFPTRRRGDYHSLDGLGRVQIPLRADLPAHLGEGIDVLKVFGTLGPTSFRWLELPSLDAKRSGLPNLESPKTSLEQLFATLTSDLAATRSTRMSQSASDEWCVASREVRVVRRAGEGS